MKQCYCLLERFNNYFNRKIIKYESLSDYEDHAKDSFIPLNEDGSMMSFDFNPADNVTTEIIVNSVPFDPDYFLLMDQDGKIVQRWFVLEQIRNRQGQWVYHLRRDVIADNLENLWNAPIFVEKGMLHEDDPFIVNSEGMNLNQVKKSETFLKDKSETAWIVGYTARNIGGSDIGPINTVSDDVQFNYETLSNIASNLGITEASLISILNFGEDETNKALFANKVKMNLWYYIDLPTPIDQYFPFHFEFSPNFSSGNLANTPNPDIWIHEYLFKRVGNFIDGETTLFKNSFISAVIQNKNNWISNINSLLDRSGIYLYEAQLNILKSYNGSYIKYNGQYYQLNISERSLKTTTKTNIINNGSNVAFTNTINTTISLASGLGLISENGYSMEKLEVEEKEVVISLKSVSQSDVIPTISTTISSSRKITGDQEYDIFAIPLNLKISNNGNSFITNEEYSRRIASAISIYQDAKVYDLQLLPYCPVPSLISNNNEIDISDLTEDEDYSIIEKLNALNNKNKYVYGFDFTYTHVSANNWTATGTFTLTDVPVGITPVIDEIVVNEEPEDHITNVAYNLSGRDITITFDITTNYAPEGSLSELVIKYHYTATESCGIMFYVPKSTFTTIINKTISVNKSKKIISNCYMWRLVSPNYQGNFEFNIAKNGGNVLSFNIFCTYKPYTPVIKVAPNFEWLYGMEYQDNRGLICGGDFSLPRVSDAWINYQLNNKNYQNIFNRDIQHLDYMQGLEMRNQLVSGAVGILGDTAKGAGAGAYVGGGVGAVVGGALGGATSAVGYAIDVDTMARTHRENRQLAIDKFNYQLGNVKALPYTLTKVGSFDAISKIFPFVEEYSCTDKEIEAFENKIKYDSMTIMRIGTLSEFANFNSELNYFKGSLIRNDEIADDPHILNAIYEEFLKGVYI